MSLAKVRSALMQGFVDAALGLPVASENRAKTPPVDSPWVEVFYVPGEPRMGTIGSKGFDVFEGYMQVNINAPLNSGVKVTMAAADTLRSYFFAGRSLDYEGQQVRIRATGTKPGFHSDSHFKTPTLINFTAHVQRLGIVAAVTPETVQGDDDLFIIDG